MLPKIKEYDRNIQNYNLRGSKGPRFIIYSRFEGVLSIPALNARYIPLLYLGFRIEKDLTIIKAMFQQRKKLKYKIGLLLCHSHIDLRLRLKLMLFKLEVLVRLN